MRIHEHRIAKERGVEDVDGHEDGDAVPPCDLRDKAQDEELVVEIEARRRLVEDDDTGLLISSLIPLQIGNYCTFPASKT